MTSASEVGARLVLSGGSAFKAEAASASASVTELGNASARAGAQARDASGRFTSAGNKVAATGVKAETAGARVTAFGNKMVVAGNKTAAAGRKMTHFFTLPIVAIGAVSVHSAVQFNASMTRIQTQAGASAKDVKILSKDVMNMAKTAQQGPEVLAESLYHLKSVGMDNVAAMKALGEASKLAAVSGAPLEDTTNALAGAWRTGIKGAGSFKQAVATLNAVVGAGNMRMSELNGALGTGILPSAKTFGLSMKDVGAALALFTDEGVPATAAATRLRMTFSLLGAPTKEAQKQLKSIGLSQYTLASDMRKPNGLVRAIGDLKKHLEDPKYHKNLNEQAGLLSRAFGGGRSSSAILSMINNYDVLVKKQEQVTKSTGKFGAAVRKQAQTPQAQLKRLEASLERLGVVLGNKLIPYVLKGVTWISRLMDKFNGLSGTTKKWIGYGVIVLATIGPILGIVGRLIRIFGLLSKAMGFLIANPIVLAIAAIAVGLYLLYKRSATFRKAVAEIVKELTKLGKEIMQKILIPAFNTLKDVIRNVMGWVDKHKAGLIQIGHVILAVVVFVIKLWIKYLQVVISVISWVGKKFWAVLKGIGEAIYWVIAYIRKHWKGLLSILTGPIGAAVIWIVSHFDKIKHVAGRVISNVVGFFKGLPKALLALGPELVKAGIHLAASIWTGLKHIIVDVSDLGKSLYNAVVGFINRDIIDKIKNWRFTIGYGPVSHTFQPFGSIPEIPMLAKGGPVEQAMPYIVGERGPELFVPNSAGEIVNNTKMTAMLDRNTVEVVNKDAGGPRTRTPVSNAIKTSPYRASADTAETVPSMDGGTKTFILQTVVDKKVIAEATYEHTRDKVARK